MNDCKKALKKMFNKAFDVVCNEDPNVELQDILDVLREMFSKTYKEEYSEWEDNLLYEIWEEHQTEEARKEKYDW